MSGWRHIVIFGAGVACAGVVAFAVMLQSASIPSLERAGSVSQLVVAENGKLLRGYLAADGRWRLATKLEDVPQSYIDTLLGYEDRRFYHHIGVDFLAMARVIGQILVRGSPVSGASTLTMQVVRLLDPGKTGLYGKLVQLVGAIRLERRLTKREILETYLTLAPFGGNIEGVRAASLYYFGKEPRSLTVSESALLVAIAQAPTRRRPDRHPLAAAEARDRVLARLASRRGGGATARLDTSLGSTIVSRPFIAPHFADRVRQLVPHADTIHTTIHANLQIEVEQIVKDALQLWPPAVNAAVLVVRNSDFAVRAYVGGDDFFGAEIAGQFDHVRAVRSPGSTLKPMIYGLGFEALIIHPSTIITDRAVNFDGYAPQNFDEEYQGDMTIREALIKSINTTAVAVLARIGPEMLVTRLRNADLPIEVNELGTSAGLAVALGGGGMTLEGLTRLYAGIASHGVVRPLKMLISDADTEGKRLLDGDVAWALADILADVPPPNGFGLRRSEDGGRRIAYKTGTSFGYRDAWAIGFDHDHTVGVWVGRSDAIPNPGAMGVTAAAPLLYRIFDLLPTPHSDVAGIPPQGSVLANRTNIPSRLHRWGNVAANQDDRALRIVFPHKDSVIETENDGDGAPFIPLMADGGDPPYFWFIDRTLLPDSDRRIRWHPVGSGPVSATVMDSTGRSTAVDFWIR